MIEPHARFTEAFNTIPEITGKKVNYKWGNEFHLNKLIKLSQNENVNPYPIIYNISNNCTQEIAKRQVTYERLQLVIATRNANVDWHNGNRWATSYKEVLFPVVNYVEQLFSKSQIFLWDRSYTLYEFPNYGNGKENQTTDIWDALRFDTRITINDKCLTTINYNL